MRADLHVHSQFSDGLYTPEEVCARAKARGVDVLSITDHDTLAGEEVKRAAAKAHGLFYVTGWEISAYVGGNKTHILGYGCKLSAPYFAFMEERTRLAGLRAEDSVRKLQELGVPVTMEEVLLERKETQAPVHTMHIARAAAKRLGLTPSETYLRYLNYGMPAQSNIGRPSPEQAIACIHDCGGLAVIAHPGRIIMGEEEKEAFLRRLVAAGADGIECAYTTHTQREREKFSALARELGVYVTGGSDTHVEDETHTIGQPRFEIGEDLLARLAFRE